MLQARHYFGGVRLQEAGLIRPVSSQGTVRYLDQMRMKTFLLKCGLDESHWLSMSLSYFITQKPSVYRRKAVSVIMNTTEHLHLVSLELRHRWRCSAMYQKGSGAMKGHP